MRQNKPKRTRRYFNTASKRLALLYNVSIPFADKWYRKAERIVEDADPEHKANISVIKLAGNFIKLNL